MEEKENVYHKVLPHGNSCPGSHIIGYPKNECNSQLYGQYGAYCQNKCGMSIGKVYNRLLTKEEVKQLRKAAEWGIVIEEGEDEKRHW